MGAADGKDESHVMETLGKAVASELYPQSSTSGKTSIDTLWEVIPETDRMLCQRIAAAVLRELREPTAAMLSAADRTTSAVIDDMKGEFPQMQPPRDLMKLVFAEMIEAVLSDTAPNTQT